MERTCEYSACGTVLVKRANESNTKFAQRRFCSMECVKASRKSHASPRTPRKRPPCVIKGCTKIRWRKGMCEAHWRKAITDDPEHGQATFCSWAECGSVAQSRGLVEGKMMNVCDVHATYAVVPL